MGALNKENIVDEIKSRCNIVDVIGQVVSLKRAGNNYKGLCPFHSEKTPSFVVSEQKQIFSCFGCNASGDVFEFVQRYYSLDFPAAIEKLASNYGIEIKDISYKSANKEELFEINRQAARFFYKALTEDSPAYAYMKKRGIEPETLRQFGVGYADSEWDSLLKHLTDMGTDVKLLVSLGLVTESKGRYYDKFRERVVFPIINTGGKVIGFGGRTLTDASPKYLNSAESSVFMKKNNLFGLNLTRQDVSKENCAILVEGYMDAISLYRHGVRNVSASLGTALTENQAKLLKRYTQNVVIAYDADAAGQAAAQRGIDILHHEGIRAKVLEITSGKDPDDYIKEKGKQDFLKLVADAMPYADYKISCIKKRYDMAKTEEKVDFVKEAVVFLKTMSPVEAETYMKKMAKDTKISESAIMLEYNGNHVVQTTKRESARDINAPKEHMPDVLEKNLIKLSISSRDYFESIKPFRHAFTSRYGYEIFSSVEENYGHGDEFDIKSLTDSLDEGCLKTFQDIWENVFLAGKEEQIFADCVKKIESNDLLVREKEIIMQLSMADEIENISQIETLTKELLKVQKEIQKKKN